MAFDNYTNKVFSWWLCWVFLCGVLACCIAGFVTANRFGFSLYGIQCAYERVYYDTIYGQQKKDYPKWDGKDDIINTTFYINKTLKIIKNSSVNSCSKLYMNEGIKDIFYKNKILEKQEKNFDINILANTYNKFGQSPLEKKLFTIYEEKSNFTQKLLLLNSFCIHFQYIIDNLDIFDEQNRSLTNLNESVDKMEIYREKFIKDFEYYVHVARAMGQIVPLIYFSLLLIFVVASGALLITYFCKKINQQWWILPMHIAWNGLRFFIFSFFIYGCAYGMLFLGSRDAIAYLKYGAFEEDNLNKEKNEVIIIPEETKGFFKYCLINNPAYESLKQNDSLNELVKTGVKLKEILNNEGSCEGDIKEDCINVNKTLTNLSEALSHFKTKKLENWMNIYDGLNCYFIQNNLNLLYRAMWDFSWEVRILCALSCCIGFFGEISVYSFLWVMHLWKREDNNYISYDKKKVNNDISNKRKKKIKNIIAPPKDIDDEATYTELSHTDKNDDEN